MFSISALSPPSTPRAPIFSPTQRVYAPWSVYALSVQSPGKRVKLESPSPMATFASSEKPSGLQPLRSSTLASRRTKKAPLSPLFVPRAKVLGDSAVASSPMASTGLSPIVMGLSLGGGGFGSTPKQPQPGESNTKKEPAKNTFPLRHKSAKKPNLKLSPLGNSREETPQPIAAVAPVNPPPMAFRLQKPAPAKKPAQRKGQGPKLSKLSVAPTGLISPPSTSTPLRKHMGRPPPLSLGYAANTLACADTSLSSPSMPQTPGGSGSAFSGAFSDTAFGEASPSLFERKTPSPADWAPTFFVTPPTPVAGDAVAEGCAAEQSSAAASLSPCTPPWPKSGSSLRKTIFDHIGKSSLSPMDLRGYMAISMSN
ncbi:hypothetical protein GGI25_005458 [Coemansia spiralis]|uniref:Uncharacterized protein n=2 Tax=Coemansia TaxID=4863 RepID=A0A9W8G386_9FUNG|nr:hypothetical protein BX070DRAFT_251326 [Coemansia spiralis]KAJ1988224.1 hypothetical protein EDC05_005424 [Coemansia umbellata]KAJ2619627.1 hypothetical protein GGI26_005681 [Coemansia sp. RSA 1358]KAJ2671591.1 hypothetical protein GGI25_005458 [Coemansia spiralis]